VASQNTDPVILITAAVLNVDTNRTADANEVMKRLFHMFLSMQKAEINFSACCVCQD
jgi:hypothetical protein